MANTHNALVAAKQHTVKTILKKISDIEIWETDISSHSPIAEIAALRVVSLESPAN